MEESVDYWIIKLLDLLSYQAIELLEINRNH